MNGPKRHPTGDPSLGPGRFESGAARWTGVILAALVLGSCVWAIGCVNTLFPRWHEVFQDRLGARGDSIVQQTAVLAEGWASSMAYVFSGVCATLCLSRSYGARFLGVLLALALMGGLFAFAGQSFAAEWEKVTETTLEGGVFDRIRFGLDPEGAGVVPPGGR